MEIFSSIVQGVTALAIIFAAWQLLFHSRQMHREFEQLYVTRYWVLMDQRSAGFTITGRARKEDRPVVRGYLQLCEDEIDLRRLGRVTDNTWEFWAGATLDQVAAPAYSKELATLRRDDYQLLRELIRTEGADPLRRNWLWRKTHGL
ncbi:hypothetical protein CLV85_0133 [Salinibacterium amurskyense]|uniref:Uncharacterized protein n=1 Tax=Salinibacterium amurskyense TaxID=205941 RepID=A0A2M9D5H8_9MICO|nr:hypothetical protein [Salinibacterium amurskyense]PJJ80966.1 hypothetical protein CLV85_0133 [Salinibacterium amurskyense]RLQ83006.1 hypothetical protein D9C83_00665 [Salinibacterium amurskyense]GHD81932.1 hypothetical protein GCM10007394_16720 [Salinibacterium amurskyense]